MFGLQLVRNISLLNEFHWRIMFKNKAKNALMWCYFEKLLEFLEFQLRTGYYLKYNEDDQGFVSMRCLLVLITFAAHFLKTEGCNDSYYTWTKFVAFCRQSGVNASNSTHMLDIEIKKSLIELQNENYLDRMYYIHKDLAGRVWTQKWMDMKCGRDGCNVKRKDNDHV